jgi:phosphate:Na+ symporter
LLSDLEAAVGAVTTVLLFHMGFNILGTALFLPVTGAFATFIARLVPDKPAAPAIDLDRALVQDSGLAIMAAAAAATSTFQRMAEALSAALIAPPDYRPLAALGPLREALPQLTEFLADIRLPEGREDQEAAYGALLHETDHLLRLMERCKQTSQISDLLDDPLLRRPAQAFAMALASIADESADLDKAAVRLQRLTALVERRTRRHRRALMLGEHAGMYKLSEVFAHTDAMRWLQRSLHHAERIAHYGHVAHEALAAAKPAAAADPVEVV